MANQATMIVSDVARFEMDGKLLLVGIYTTDIGIFAIPTVAPTMSFYVVAEGDLSDRPSSIECEITVPGQPPFRHPPVKLADSGPFAEGRTRWVARSMATMVNVSLSPGHITGRMILDDREILMSGPWVTLMPNAAARTDEAVKPDLASETAAPASPIVLVGGRRYEIGGFGYGKLPAWRFVKIAGQPMTGDQFDALSVPDKAELARHVQAHIDRLSRG